MGKRRNQNHAQSNRAESEEIEEIQRDPPARQHHGPQGQQRQGPQGQMTHFSAPSHGSVLFTQVSVPQSFLQGKSDWLQSFGSMFATQATEQGQAQYPNRAMLTPTSRKKDNAKPQSKAEAKAEGNGGSEQKPESNASQPNKSSNNSGSFNIAAQGPASCDLCRACRKHCHNCGQRTHWLAQCMGPLDVWGKIPGCGWCGTTDHIYEACSHWDETPEALERVILGLRVNRPQMHCTILPPDHPGAQPGGSYENRMPWSAPAAKQYKREHPEFWLQFSYASNTEKDAVLLDGAATWNDRMDQTMDPSLLVYNAAVDGKFPAHRQIKVREKKRPADQINDANGEPAGKRTETEKLSGPSSQRSSQPAAPAQRLHGSGQQASGHGQRPPGDATSGPRPSGRGKPHVPVTRSTAAGLLDYVKQLEKFGKPKMGSHTLQCLNCGIYGHHWSACNYGCGCCGQCPALHNTKTCNDLRKKCNCSGEYPGHLKKDCPLPCRQHCGNNEDHNAVGCVRRCARCGEPGHLPEECINIPYLCGCGSKLHFGQDHLLATGEDPSTIQCGHKGCTRYFCWVHCKACLREHGDINHPCPSTVTTDDKGRKWVHCGVEGHAIVAFGFDCKVCLPVSASQFRGIPEEPQEEPVAETGPSAMEVDDVAEENL